VSEKKLLWNAGEIRFELYEIWNGLQSGWNNHLAAFTGSTPPHNREECTVCHFYTGRQQGINRAIRHFGGRVRAGRMP